MLVACRRLQLLALERLAQLLDARRAHAHRAADLRCQLLQRGLHNEPPAVDDQHLVDRLCDLCQHMARDQHRTPPRGERAQEVTQPAHALGVKAVGRLVQHQQLGIAKQRRCKPQPLAHAERVALHATSGGVLQFHQRQHLVGARVGQAGSKAECAQMVAARAARVEVSGLEHRADPQRRLLQLRIELVEHERAATRRHRQAEQHPQRRRLARAVGAQKARDRARGELERQVLDCCQPAKALRQRLCANDCRHALIASSGTSSRADRLAPRQPRAHRFARRQQSFTLAE